MKIYQNFMKPFSGKRWVLALTAGFFITVGFFTLTSMTTDHVDFSGEWKLNESKSNYGKFPLCIFGGDRMRSKTLKITGQTGFLTVEAASSFVNGVLVIKQEKLVFDGKVNQATYVGTPREKSAAKWSADGQTMTVNSVRSLDADGKIDDFKITEVWKLINGGKSITIQVHSNSTSSENTMTLIYDKQSADDYRF